MQQVVFKNDQYIKIAEQRKLLASDDNLKNWNTRETAPLDLFALWEE